MEEQTKTETRLHHEAGLRERSEVRTEGVLRDDRLRTDQIRLRYKNFVRRDMHSGTTHSTQDANPRAAQDCAEIDARHQTAADPGD